MLILESSPTCRYDYVTVYRGNTASENNLIRRFCGDHSFDLPILATNASIVTVDFASDNIFTYSGFKATVQFVTGINTFLVVL